MNQPVRKRTDSGVRCNSQVNDPPQDNTSAGHISVIDNGDELRRKQKKYNDKLAFYKETHPTFTTLAKRLMERKQPSWSSGTFSRKTYLDESMYRKIYTNDDKGWSLRTVLAFCVGICASEYLATQVLASAGYVLTSSDEDQAYALLFTEFEGCSMEECNYFLESIHIEPLGSKTRITEEAW